MEIVLNEFAPLRRVVVKHARDAFLHPVAVEREWQRLGFSSPPHYARAVEEYDRFVERLGTGQ